MSDSTETQTTETAQSSPATGAPAKKATEVGSVFVSNYPPFSAWKADGLDEYRQVLATPPAEDAPTLGLYLHIPFCRKRCKFCYFRVYIDKNASEIQRYLDNLAREVELYAAQPAFANRQLDFVYFGGGTPSYIAAKHLRALVDRVQAVMPWTHAQEITFECEPGTLTQSKLDAIREIGVTRLSLGIENWNEDILRDNGRAHLTHEIDRCLPWIRERNFDQLNVDLIAGMVGETWDTWRDTVKRTVDIDPDSVTTYQMELPFNTVYSKDILDGGNSPVADWQTKRAWNDYAIEELSAAGYEISSAYTMVKRRKGDDGKSQFAYRDSLWHGADLLGTGIASFGHLGGVHFQNVTGWKPYLDALEAGELALGRAYATSADERLTRELILQMKLGKLRASYFQEKFGVDVLQRWGSVFSELETRDMLQVDGDQIELSRQGLLQVDTLLPGFYEDHFRNARYT